MSFGLIVDQKIAPPAFALATMLIARTFHHPWSWRQYYYSCFQQELAAL